LTYTYYFVDFIVFQICNGLASIDPLRHFHPQYIIDSKLCLLNDSSVSYSVTTDTVTSSDLVPSQLDETTSWDWAINLTMTEWMQKNSIQRSETHFDMDIAHNNELAKKPTNDLYAINRLFKTDSAFREKVTQLLNDHQTELLNTAKKALEKSGALNATVSMNTKGAKQRFQKGSGP
jgi:hypothetical protein